jgi:hypothetical protein
MRAPDVWKSASFLSIFLALSFSRFDSASQPSPTTATHTPSAFLRQYLLTNTLMPHPKQVHSNNAPRYAFRQVWNLVYFYLDEIEHIFYNLARENAHEKNDRFIIYYIEDD